MSQARINIFVTAKSKKFRARIKEEGKPPYEVTVGGISWINGKGQEHHARIIEHCKGLIQRFEQQIEHG